MQQKMLIELKKSEKGKINGFYNWKSYTKTGGEAAWRRLTLNNGVNLRNIEMNNILLGVSFLAPKPPRQHRR